MTLVLQYNQVYTFQNGDSNFLSFNKANNQILGTQDKSLNILWTALFDDNDGRVTLNTTDSSGNPFYLNYGNGSTTFYTWPIPDNTGKEYLRIEAFDSRGMVLQINPDLGVVLSTVELNKNDYGMIDLNNPAISSQVWDFVLFNLTCDPQTGVCVYCASNSSFSAGEYCL